MHLLCLDQNAEPTLVEHVGYPTPPYAIMSHTWGSIEEEVTFKDVRKGRGRNKTGYAKLIFCLKQAAADNLKYCWLDTCCIDKSSSAELSEAINSMFRWYKEAVKCYVYLADVSVFDKGSASPQSWMGTFERSRWFTRGWTLQELLAPSSLDFFSVEGQRLGDKDSLKDIISQITKIATTALEGKRLAHFELEEIFRWTENRRTTREEDEAYSLLGIFDVSMPILYGEGKRKAMVRLKKQVNESIDEQYPPLDCLGKGQQLLRGELLQSRDESYRLDFQNDGNLVLSGSTGILWTSNTAGRSDARTLTMQDDGNLVLYAQDGKWIWSTETFVSARPRFRIHNDGNAVVSSHDEIIWATHTKGGLLPDTVEHDQKMYINQPVVSHNKRYSFVLQNDGNIVLMGPSGVLWSSGHPGRDDVQYWMLQLDGNLVLFRDGDHPVWAVMCFTKNRPQVKVQDDGNFVAYAGGEAYWATETSR